MLSVNPLLEQVLPSRRNILIIICTLAVGIAAGLLAAQHLFGVIIFMLAMVIAAALFFQAHLATLIVVFVLYTNLAAVGMKFYSVPVVIGTAFPLLLLVPLVQYLIFNRQKPIFNRVFMLMIVFLAIQLLGTFFAKDTSTALSNLITYGSEGLLLYFLFINAVRTPEMLRRVIWVLLLAGILMGGVPLYQQVTGTFDNNYGGLAQLSEQGFRTGEIALEGEVRQPRLSGTIGEQNRYAQVMLMLVPLGFFQSWNERSKIMRTLALFATAISGLGAMLAFSRGAAVGFVLLILIMVAIRAIKPHQLIVFVLGISLLMAAFPQYSVRLLSMESVMTLIDEESSTVDGPDGAIQGRTTVMLAALQVFLDHPVIGVGPGMVKYYTREYGNQLDIRHLEGTREAHSLYLAIAANTGLLGLTAFLATVFVTLRGLNNARRRWAQERPELAHMATGFMLSIISYMTTGIFLHPSFVRYFWLMMALAGSAIYVSEIPTATDELAG
jgi:putative inorganic carbon (hco3(-)) transporter